MKIILAQSAASGAIYTRQILEILIASPAVSHIALIRSTSAAAVTEFEQVILPSDAKVVEYQIGDMFAPAASGSARYDAMIVAPCSVATVGRIAAGTSDNLILRAADVQLKERRRLLLLVRETPLSLIHLRNMVALTEAGAVVMPASPSFYNNEKTLEELTVNISRRAATAIGVECGLEAWSGKKVE